MPHTTEAATLCANPDCTRAKHHPGLCTDEIAARTGLTVEQVQTVFDFEAETPATSEPTFARTVTRLAREYRSCLPDNAAIPPWHYVRIMNQLHVAADMAGISHHDAAKDLFDEINAEPVTA